MRKILNFNFKKRPPEEYSKFIVSISTSHQSSFQIKYPRKDYNPRIDECINKIWERRLHVSRSKPLYIEVFLTNPLAYKDLICEVLIEELNFDSEVIQTVKFSFVAGIKLDNWQWERFEAISILSTNY